MASAQRRSNETREKLLVAAREVFADKGYVRATVAEIVATAGRAHGTFYLHFKNKRDVFRTLLDDAIESLKSQSKVMWHEDNPTHSVFISVLRFLEEFEKNRDLWLLLDQMATIDGDFNAMRKDWRELFVMRICRGIEQSETGAISGLDAHIIASTLAAMVDEIARVASRETQDWEPSMLALHITTLWARGLGYPPGELDSLAAELGFKIGASSSQLSAGQAT